MSASDNCCIRVLIVDDHATMRAGLCLLFSNEPGIVVVGEAANREQTLALAASEHPDIILLDLMLGTENALDFLPELLVTTKQARVVVLTASRDLQVHRQAVTKGVMGILTKEQSPEMVIRAIQRVHAGEVWIERALMANVLNSLVHANGSSAPETGKISTLSERELEIITLISQGVRNPQIAERLFLSESTVRHHITSIYNKLGVSDRLDLVLYAYQYGLATPPRFLG